LQPRRRQGVLVGEATRRESELMGWARIKDPGSERSGAVFSHSHSHSHCLSQSERSPPNADSTRLYGNSNPTNHLARLYNRPITPRCWAYKYRRPHDLIVRATVTRDGPGRTKSRGNSRHSFGGEYQPPTK
jgi:hypothetical protein